jgi:hypothetical protein
VSIGVDVDGELLVVAALLELLVDDDHPVEVLTVLPTTLPPLVVRVTLFASVSDYDTSTLRVDLESFAATRAEARDLAGRVHTAVHALPGRTAAGQQFDAVAGQLPVWRFWSESRHRFIGTYSIDLRAR